MGRLFNLPIPKIAISEATGNEYLKYRVKPAVYKIKFSNSKYRDFMLN